MKKLLSCAAAVVALSGLAAAPAHAARDYDVKQFQLRAQLDF
jgi:hypothetical protein